MIICRPLRPDLRVAVGSQTRAGMRLAGALQRLEVPARSMDGPRVGCADEAAEALWRGGVRSYRAEVRGS